jgi:hypothetical protein
MPNLPENKFDVNKINALDLPTRMRLINQILSIHRVLITQWSGSNIDIIKLAEAVSVQDDRQREVLLGDGGLNYHNCLIFRYLKAVVKSHHNNRPLELHGLKWRHPLPLVPTDLLPMLLRDDVIQWMIRN